MTEWDASTCTASSSAQRHCPTAQLLAAQLAVVPTCPSAQICNCFVWVYPCNGEANERQCCKPEMDWSLFYAYLHLFKHSSLPEDSLSLQLSVSFHSICHNVSFSIYKSSGRKALQTSILKVLISLHFQDCFCPPTPSGIPLWRETGGLQTLKVARLRWSSLGLCI